MLRCIILVRIWRIIKSLTLGAESIVAGRGWDTAAENMRTLWDVLSVPPALKILIIQGLRGPLGSANKIKSICCRCRESSLAVKCLLNNAGVRRWTGKCPALGARVAIFFMIAIWAD
jgi:hypothetical protein